MVSSLFGRDRSAGPGTYNFYYRGVYDPNRQYPFSIEVTPSQVMFCYSGLSFFLGKSDRNNNQSVYKFNSEDFISQPILILPTFQSSLEGRNSESEIIAIYNDSINTRSPLTDNRKFTTFSSLKVKEGILPDAVWQSESESPPGTTNKFYIRQLLLDFLFELRHETTFQDNLPPEIYATLSQWVENYFILKAISAKFEYYYHRQILEEDWKKSNFNKNFENEKRLKWSLSLSDAEIFLESECEWAGIVRSPQAVALFYTTNWFADVEEEMIEINKFNDTCKRQCINSMKASKEKLTDKHTFLRNRLDRSFEQNVYWFSSRHNHSEAFAEVQRVLKLYKILNWPIIMTIFFILLIIEIVRFPQFLSFTSFAYFSTLITGLLIGLRLIKNKSFLSLVFPATNSRLLLSVATFWIIIASTKDTWEMVFEMSNMLLWVSSITILIFSLVLAWYDVLIVTNPAKKTKRPVWKQFKRAGFLLVIGVFYALLSGILIQQFLGERTIISSEIYDEMKYKMVIKKMQAPETDIYSIAINHRLPSFGPPPSIWNSITYGDLITAYEEKVVGINPAVINPGDLYLKMTPTYSTANLDNIMVTPLKPPEEKKVVLENYCYPVSKDPSCLEFTERIHRQWFPKGYIMPGFLVIGSLLSVFFSMVAFVLTEKRKAL